MNIMSRAHAVKKYTFLAQTSFNSKVAYPIDVLVRTLFFALILFIFTQLWGALLGEESSIASFTRSQLVWYLMITEAIMLSNSRIDRRIEDDVKSGAVAYILIRPLHFVWYQCSIYFGETLGLLLFNLVVGTGVALALVGPPPLALMGLPVLFLAVLLAFLINFFVRMALALLAFWVEDTGPFFWVYSKVLFTLGGLFMPIEIYPEWLQRISHALPFNYILYRPARLFVSFQWQDALATLGGQMMWTVVLMVLVLLIYSRGVKKVSVNGG
jgi:ABC-2 type transport system permease protein